MAVQCGFIWFLIEKTAADFCGTELAYPICVKWHKVKNQ